MAQSLPGPLAIAAPLGYVRENSSFRLTVEQYPELLADVIEAFHKYILYYKYY